MTENEFLSLAEETFEEIEEKIEKASPDCDCLREGNVLTIETPEEKSLVLNIQSSTQEIWLASPAGGSRYGYKDKHWINSKTDSELMEDVLSQIGGTK
ncbi:MAG: iron donor protein CyaY [Burkholderiales bacterium]|nr:iron donor protein CyaY [Burkholderiales bacterium]